MTIPKEINHDFESEMILIHPITEKKTKIPISFSNKAGKSWNS